MENGKNWVLLLVGNELGAADNELGTNLMRMFLYTLAEGNDLPASVLLMNKGVLLACEDEQTVKHLNELAAKGVEISACGTCLNFYNVADKLQAGSVGNMQDITAKIVAAPKVVTL